MAPADPPTPQLRLRDGAVAWRELGNELVLLDLRQSTYLATNPAATLLWRRLEQGTTRQELVDALVEAYEIPAERAESDVDEFIADCRRRDLLDPGPAND